MSFEVIGVKLVAEDGGFFGTMQKADKAVSGFGDTNKNVFSQMPGLADIAVGAFHKVGAMAVEAFAQAGLAAVGFIKDSIGVAGDFESGMNKFAAVAGKALDESGLELKDFRDQFIQIGKELPVSTQEVQNAAIEMVKGGIEPATIAAGGLRQVIQFAAAADLDLEQASTIAAKSLGGWTDMAATAQEKADFLTHSTDLLAKAANASTVDVGDLALGLYNVQGTAKLAGLSFDETVTTLAELAPSFASSADAGTSFKAFLSRLQPSTNPARDAMKSLGLWTEEAGSKFYDAQGKFIGMEKASGILQDATKDLNDAQRAQILQTIFGQDAIRVAAVLTEQGAKGYNNMTDALAKQNSVQDMAAQKQAGFNTAMDNFKGSVEALQITIGSLLLPVLTTLFNDYLAPAVNTITDVTDALAGNDEAFARLSPTLQGVVKWIGDLFTGTGGLSDIWTNTLYPAIQTAGTYFQENIVPILENLANIVFPILGTSVGLIAAAWENILWPALKTVWDVISTFVIPILKDVTAWLAENLPPAVQKVSDFLTNTLFPAIHKAWDFIDANLIPILKDVVKWLEENVPPALKKAADFWNNILWPALNKVWDFINKNVVPIFMTVVQWLRDNIPLAIQKLSDFWNNVLLPAITAVWNFINDKLIPLFNAVARVAEAVLGLAIRTLTKIWNEELYPVIEKVYNWFKDNISPILGTVGDKAGDLASKIRDTLAPAFTWLNDNVLQPVVGWFSSISDAISKAIDWLNKLADAINSLPSMPDPMTGHSPPPMAKWMYEIGNQSAYAANAMNAVGSSIRGIPASPMAIMAAGATSNTYNQQRSVALNYHTTYAPPANQSLAIANALSGI